MATHSSTLAWKIPWMEAPGRLQSMGSLRVRHDWLHFHFSFSCIVERNGNRLQYSCLENPRDGGGWWAAVYGVAQSPTQLKWLSSSMYSVAVILHVSWLWLWKCFIFILQLFSLLFPTLYCKSQRTNIIYMCVYIYIYIYKIFFTLAICF